MSERRLAHFLGHLTVSAGQVARATVVRFCFSCCTVFVILWIAILLYMSFYYAYMPTVRHVRPVFLLFKSVGCEKSRISELCSFPEANLSLTTGERMLMRGQQYQVFLDLEMPHSPVNEKLGMFIVKLTFLSDAGKVLARSERSGMLHYQSALLQSLGTVFYFLPMVLGLSEEKQIVQVRMFEEYVEDSYQPAVGVNVIVMSKQIEIYSAALRIEARFSGLRSILIKWPTTSALVAVTVNFMIISMVFFFAYSAFSPVTALDGDSQVADLSIVTQEQQRAPWYTPYRRVRPGNAPVSLRYRRASSGRLRKKPDMATREQTRTGERGGMVKCASFPSCIWDASSPLSTRISRSLHGSLSGHHNPDTLDESRSSSCHCGIAEMADQGTETLAASQHLLTSADSIVDTDPYRVVTFPAESKGKCTAGGTCAHIHSATTETSPSFEDETEFVKRGRGGLRYKSHRRRVQNQGDSSSMSASECIHSHAAGPRYRRQPSNSCDKSSDSDELSHGSLCEYRSRVREYPACSARCCRHSQECRDCAELVVNGPLKSGVPDGATAASSSGIFHNWSPQLRRDNANEVERGSRRVQPQSDMDEAEAKKRRPTNKTKARFGLSFRSILSRRDLKTA